MTAQIPDSLWYGHERFNLVGVDGESGSDLFVPQRFGLCPTASASTACRRGYYVEYEVVNGRLLATNLHINIDPRWWPSGVPRLFGITPTLSEPNQLVGFYRYEGIDFALPFSGGILAGTKFIRDLHVHMGFQAPWKYEQVLELCFTHGYLKEVGDYSKEVASIRDERLKEPVEPMHSSTPLDVDRWISQCFRRDYAIRRNTH